jgi:hypothetical protein
MAASALTTGTERCAGRAPATARDELDRASDNLSAAEGVLTTQAPNPVALRKAVDGTIRLANSLARLVTTPIGQAPASLDRRSSTGPILGEFQADLRALRGCLTTGALLPSRGEWPSPTKSSIREAADHDVADQQRPTRPDAADQRRDAPVLDETGPGPDPVHPGTAQDKGTPRP